jgi:hypothetical protein
LALGPARGSIAGSMKKRLSVTVAVGLLLVSISASATQGEAEPAWVTRGWAGYVVRTHAGSFERVKGSWAQPKIVCNRPGSSAAFWVGLGGASANSAALEQVGTSADCSGSALAAYSAWYQLFPAPAVELPLSVRPGDTIAAEVAVSGRTVTVELRNLSTGSSFSAERWMRSPETDSAEWSVEAPSTCFVMCEQLPLADFGRVRFTNSFATVGAQTGTIRNPAWSRQRLEMGMRRGRLDAVPMTLSVDGSSFEVIRLPPTRPFSKPLTWPKVER